MCNVVKEQLTTACRTNEDVPRAHQTFLTKLESMNLEKQLQEYDATHDQDPMYTWARMCMKQVTVLLQFQRATREGNWFLYLAALEKLRVYFFAYNRLDYAQNIPARMHELKNTAPLHFTSQNPTSGTSYCKTEEGAYAVQHIQEILCSG